MDIVNVDCIKIPLHVHSTNGSVDNFCHTCVEAKQFIKRPGFEKVENISFDWVKDYKAKMERSSRYEEERQLNMGHVTQIGKSNYSSDDD